MSHILCHNKTAYCCCGSKHYKDCNQFFLTESQFHSNRKKNCHKYDQLHNCCCHSRFDLSKCFPKIKGSSHCHQPHWCGHSSNTCHRFIKNCRHWILQADQIRPATIPMMIGLVTIPFNVFIHTALSIAFRSGWKKDNTITAITL